MSERFRIINVAPSWYRIERLLNPNEPAQVQLWTTLKEVGEANKLIPVYRNTASACREYIEERFPEERYGSQIEELEVVRMFP